MGALQPKMEAIRAKYATKIKNDPNARLKMNEETMALYKQEGVNPAGGCLPLLLQMPILIAFYNLSPTRSSSGTRRSCSGSPTSR